MGNIYGLDVGSALGAALGFLAAGLFWWAAKHILDRFALPRYLDWLASRNRKRALIRARTVLETLHVSVWTSVSLRLAIAKAAISAIIGISFFSMLLFLAIIALKILLQPWEWSPRPEILSLIFYSICALGIAISAVLIATGRYQFLERRRIIQDLHGHVTTEHQRVRQLLVAAKVPETEIEELLNSSQKEIQEAFDFRSKSGDTMT